MSDGKSVLAPNTVFRQPSPTTGAILQYDRRNKFTRQDMLTALAARADFKFEIYDTAWFQGTADSYFILGHGVDAINTAMARISGDPRAYAIITDGVGLVLKLTLIDLAFIHDQYVALYGETTKPPFDAGL